MAALNLSLILDGLMVLLLILTIAYAFVLNRKLSRLRGEHAEWSALIEKLNLACARSEAAVDSLRNAGENGRQVFREAATKAEALRDELAFLVDRADIAATRLAGASEGTALGQSGAAKPAARKAAPRAQPGGGAARPDEGEGSRSRGDDDQARSEAERELLKALRNAR